MTARRRRDVTAGQTGPAEQQCAAAQRGAAAGEQGMAAVEFTLVAVLLTLVFLAVLQFGFVIHVRNTLVASAAEGARYAANANRGVGDGATRTEALIAESLSPALATDIRARMIVGGGTSTVEVTVTTTLPLAGLLGVERGLTVSAHAVAEPGR